MAVEHAHVFADLGCELVVAGRGESSAAAFALQTQIEPETGGIDRVLGSLEPVPDTGVVAVSVAELAPVTRSLIEAGVRRILVEKPAGLKRDEVGDLVSRAQTSRSAVFVAYNRRFYASVARARELIVEDGGVTSFIFDFTELSGRVAESAQPSEVKARWFVANSTHVVDLAFFLGGEPAEISTRVGGSLSWHPVASFVGAGKSTTGATFSYHADWTGPGRWGVEVVTSKRRLVLRPLEELKVQEHGEWVASPVDLGTDIDTRFKAGLHAQARAFLAGDDRDLMDIAAQLDRFDRVYEPMLGGRR